MKPIIIVTGAGASIPFGYPSGAELRKQILISMYPHEEQYNKSKRLLLDSYMFEERQIKQELPDHQLFLDLGFSTERMEAFWKEFLGSNVTSIDRFLESNQNSHLQIGKAAIANSILKTESKDAIHKENSWLKYIWNQIKPAKINQLSRVLENLKFITFNYDRLLEYFFHHVIKNTYGLNDSDAGELMKSLQIIHLHGRLLPLPWEVQQDQKINRADYGYNPKDFILHLNNVKVSMNSISLVFEKKRNKEDFNTARRFLEGNQSRYLLGYGFDPMNNKNLGLTIEPEIRFPPSIVCTAVGLTPHEQGIIRREIGASFKLFPENNIDLLRNHGSFR